MCGRITQKSNPSRLGLGLTTVTLVEPLQVFSRYNGAPAQHHCVIRQNPKTGERTLDRLWWGLIPYWVNEASGGREPINAKAETVASLASFRNAYRRRRCLLPIDNFFEWRAIKGARAKQSYAVGMTSGEPFAPAAIWENWQRPRHGRMAAHFRSDHLSGQRPDGTQIHDRMPVIIPPQVYDRWLAQYRTRSARPAGAVPERPMTMWPISTRVNKPENDDPAILQIVTEPDAPLL